MARLPPGRRLVPACTTGAGSPNADHPARLISRVAGSPGTVRRGQVGAPFIAPKKRGLRKACE